MIGFIELLASPRDIRSLRDSIVGVNCSVLESGNMSLCHRGRGGPPGKCCYTLGGNMGNIAEHSREISEIFLAGGDGGTGRQLCAVLFIMAFINPL